MSEQAGFAQELVRIHDLYAGASETFELQVLAIVREFARTAIANGERCPGCGK